MQHSILPLGLLDNTRSYTLSMVQQWNTLNGVFVRYIVTLTPLQTQATTSEDVFEAAADCISSQAYSVEVSSPSMVPH